MPLTLLFLQVLNAGFAALSFWVLRYRINLWEDQGLLFIGATGTVCAALTLLVLGLSAAMLRRWPGVAWWVHLVMTLGFLSFQAWLLFTLTRELGLFPEVA